MVDDNFNVQECTGCGEIKPFSAYAKHPSGKNGLRAKCKRCANAVRMISLEKSREKVREQGRVAAAARRATDSGRKNHQNASLEYYRRNKAKVMAKRRKRWAEDPVFRLLAWQRTSMHRLLGGRSSIETSKCAAMLGYTAEELRDHIERQFTKGMGWHNMGQEVHIDHIVPVASFIKRGVTDPKVIHALSNLRPMWADKNRAKGARQEFLL